MPKTESLDILFLTQVLPFPLVGGPKIRAYYMLRYLAKRHRVTLISFVRPSDNPADIGYLKQYCEEVVTVPIQRSISQNVSAMVSSLWSGEPAVIRRDWQKGMVKQLECLVQEKQFDVIHADQTSMAQYGLYAFSCSKPNNKPRLLLDEHNALFQFVERQAKYERPISAFIWRREGRCLARYEADLCRKFDHILTVTGQDKNTLLNLFLGSEIDLISSKISSIPICVEPDGAPPTNLQTKQNQILHLGTMFWPPNRDGVLWFANSVLPLIMAQIPDVNFVVAGMDPPPSVQSLSSLESPIFGHVEVKGFVADPESLIDKSKVFVVPVHAAGGMRVKILKAWQWGIPIVSTTIGAEGIATEHGQNILLADDPIEFSEAVVGVMTDDRLASRLINNGWASVVAKYDWRKVYTQLDDIYDKLVA